MRLFCRSLFMDRGTNTPNHCRGATLRPSKREQFTKSWVTRDVRTVFIGTDRLDGSFIHGCFRQEMDPSLPPIY